MVSWAALSKTLQDWTINKATEWDSRLGCSSGPSWTSLQERTSFLSFPHGDGTVELDSHVICLEGLPNVGFIRKNVKKPSGNKNKRALPEGDSLIPDSETNQGDPQFSSEKDLNRVTLGAWSILKQGQKPLPESCEGPFPLLISAPMPPKCSKHLPFPGGIP